MEGAEKRFKAARSRSKRESPYPPGLPDDVVRKAQEIDKIFDEERRYGLPGTPDSWEIAGQTTAKLRVAAGDPEVHDPSGELRKKYEETIKAFDVGSGTFPHNFDPETGLYTE